MMTEQGDGGREVWTMTEQGNDDGQGDDDSAWGQ